MVDFSGQNFSGAGAVKMEGHPVMRDGVAVGAFRLQMSTLFGGA